MAKLRLLTVDEFLVLPSYAKPEPAEQGHTTPRHAKRRHAKNPEPRYARAYRSPRAFYEADL